MYIYQRIGWPNFTWHKEKVFGLLVEVRHLQGLLLGKMRSLGFELQDQAILETITLDIVKSNEIEGEYLLTDEVRSSVAKKLGVAFSSAVKVGRYTDGVVDMMLDATQHYWQPIDAERLFGWHAALFPTGRSGMHSITVGNWRKGEAPMQVVSGGMGRERIHFEAPKSAAVPKEMKLFLQQMEEEHNLDNILLAAIAHLWFVTIHPFDDGNGRIARAISDLFLARSDKSQQRFYSMSAAILENKKGYYSTLESVQKGTLDITDWMLWFLATLEEAILSAEEKLKTVLDKAAFWHKHGTTTMNERQKYMVNKLLDGFTGKLRTSKWAKITKCSEKTALRDIEDLVAKGILEKGEAGGRSTFYYIKSL